MRVGERTDGGAHRRALDRRQIALDVDDDVVAPLRVDRRERLENAVGAGGVIGPRQHGAPADRLDRRDDRGVIGGDQHRPDIGLDRAPPDMDDHRLARGCRRAACRAIASKPGARE